jgi:peptidoglycan/LPS O-acetylase OafA/YrhL
LQRSRLDSLTGIRFIAAFLVFVNHVSDALMDRGSILHEPFQRGGRVGVGFFYVLSGFVLTWAMSAGDGPRAFYQRRVARIVPNHLVTWVLALAIGLGGVATVETDLPGALLSLVLLQSWHPSSDVHFAMNSVSWSISCELFFYATFPFVLPLLRRLSVRRLGAAFVMIAAGIVVVAAISYVALPGQVERWFLYVFPVTRLAEFVLGIIVALLLRAGRWPDVGLYGALAMSFAAIVVLPFVPEAFHYAAVTAVPFSFLIAAAALRDAQGRSTWFMHRALVRLGEWSFAFYLVHELVIRVARENADIGGLAPAAGILVAGVLLGIAVAASGALHRVVERPLERRLRPPRVSAAVVDTLPEATRPDSGDARRGP